MTSKSPEPKTSAKTLPSEAGHNRNTDGQDKGLAERSVNEPHIETADKAPDTPAGGNNG